MPTSRPVPAGCAAGWPARAARRAAPLALFLVLLLAGCSTVPPGGAIFAARGQSEADPLGEPYVRMLVAPPKQNGTPAEIVDGFLAAAASPDDPQRTVARRYLTGDADRTWSPFDGTTIYEGRTVSDGRGEDLPQAHVTLKGTVLGTLDGDGHYVLTDASAGSELAKGFTLVRVNGQWRISSAPSGLLLSEDDFKRGFRPFDVYFAAPRWAGLVADRVRVRVDPAEGLAETLVRKLLDGPTKPMRGAVDSAFSGVDVNGVSVEENSVVVDFTYAVVDSAADAGRRALGAQLAWTLKPLTEARRIEVRVNGEQFPGGAFVIDPRDYDRFDPDVLPSGTAAYYPKDGRLHSADGKSDNPLPLGDGAAAGQYTEFAVSGSGGDRPQRLAALSRNGGVWVSAMGAPARWERWIQGQGLTPPSFDRYGDVWTVARQGPRRSQVLRAADASRQYPVRAPDIETADVRAFRVARDGVRVAVVCSDEHGQRVLIGYIDRGGWSVGNFRELVPAEKGQQILDVAWQDADTLWVLTNKHGSDGELTPWSVTQGVRADSKVAARVERIAAAPGDSPLLVLNSGGELAAWNAQKSRWESLVKKGAGPPVYPLG
ncbi:lipoprotein LpqB [Sphaerisporangium rufum]|uniref:Lipoprotein LpqB n=1 Tax=Sphaerisporangium rufum TaxID=1381558 RepID=A0A919QZ17_9ACTN|nr:LpqB family beta-propeller domain-containing protein [Sphaerisporangium rufum]GII75376.1 lipoprotein LpqB [Sphaerisporangium rufum]